MRHVAEWTFFSHFQSLLGSNRKYPGVLHLIYRAINLITDEIQRNVYGDYDEQSILSEHLETCQVFVIELSCRVARW